MRICFLEKWLEILNRMGLLINFANVVGIPWQWWLPSILEFSFPNSSGSEPSFSACESAYIGKMACRVVSAKQNQTSKGLPTVSVTDLHSLWLYGFSSPSLGCWPVWANTTEYLIWKEWTAYWTKYAELGPPHLLKLLDKMSPKLDFQSACCAFHFSFLNSRSSSCYYQCFFVIVHLETDKTDLLLFFSGIHSTLSQDMNTSITFLKSILLLQFKNNYD